MELIETCFAEHVSIFGILSCGARDPGAGFTRGSSSRTIFEQQNSPAGVLRMNSISPQSSRPLGKVVKQVERE
jgi:hypothetical protein